MIAITGATGQLGSLVIEQLLKSIAANQIVAIARSEQKAAALSERGVSVKIADYNQPQTLAHALAGVDKLLLISSSEVGQRRQQHQAVIDAAAAANVKFIAYTSILNADTSPLGLALEHKATEALLQDSGVPYALLRNGWYSENYAMGAQTAVALGAVYGCAGEGRISSAPRSDFAAAAAAVMLKDNQAGNIYELAGDRAYTLAELAGEISTQTGKNIEYVNLTEADYAGALMQAGLPQPLAEMLADSDTGASKGGLYSDSRDLHKLIGRETVPMAETLRTFL